MSVPCRFASVAHSTSFPLFLFGHINQYFNRNMAPKRGNDGEECMQYPLTSTCPSYQITDTSPASPDSKRQKMGREELLPSATATDGTLVISVAPGAPVNTWGMYFEGMSGKSTLQTTKSPTTAVLTTSPSEPRQHHRRPSRPVRTPLADQVQPRAAQPSA